MCVQYFVIALSLMAKCLETIYYIIMCVYVSFVCLAASNWSPGNQRSDHHVSNPHRPDYY